mmetsp:Transcript_17302/g.67299  ORF Transcript_17302/g.67299 Transcript_17302/m.67299 type:complete len:421 (+) Transcript_17302:32-1294(+)
MAEVGERERVVLPEEDGEETYGNEHVTADGLLQTLKVAKGIAGYKHPMVLDVLFEAFGMLIKDYRLSACDELLEDAREEVLARGKEDKYSVQMQQALAFLRFKQFRFAEAVQHFEAMREVVPANAFLLENTGHAYNSLGDQAAAERCFKEALTLIDAAQSRALAALLAEQPELEGSVDAAQLDVPEAANKGGLLMGLGLVLHRTGRHVEGLELLQQARAFYAGRAARAAAARVGDERVLVAKAEVSVAGALAALGRLGEAAQSYAAAVDAFAEECGRVNPLTADALRKLGLLLLRQGREAEAEQAMSEALELAVAVDAFSVNVYNLAELVIALFQLHGRQGVHEARAAWYVPLLTTALAKVRLQKSAAALASPEFVLLSNLAEELAEIAAAYAAAHPDEADELAHAVAAVSLEDDTNPEQ